MHTLLQAVDYNQSLMRVAIGADHAGFELKQALVRQLVAEGHELLDVGAVTFNSRDDYVDFALAASEKVRQGEAERGILVCGSGVGSSVAANKLKGIRACICHDTYSARQGVEHDDLNVLCLGGRVVGTHLASEVVRAFLAARYTADERHERRLEKVREAELKG